MKISALYFVILLFHLPNRYKQLVWFILDYEVRGMPNIPDEYWKAIVECDPIYDETFLYGVKTTGIYCRPSCKSREPKKENVQLFNNSYMALEANFRPCKRYKPDGLAQPNEDWVGQIAGWLDVHYSEPTTLETLGELFHGSPFHLQRLFKKVKGMSPTDYIQKVRLEKAMELLNESEMAVTEITSSVGFRSTPYFVTLFKEKLGCTPAAYRKKGREHDGKNGHP
jgi:AraC family transcriptional regulator, regulatory protein of adaptative response / methylphosphotriester-DNA alkyltransferase methyltransferase